MNKASTLESTATMSCEFVLAQLPTAPKGCVYPITLTALGSNRRMISEHFTKVPHSGIDHYNSIKLGSRSSFGRGLKG